WLTPTPEEKETLTVAAVVDHFMEHKRKQYEDRFRSREDLEPHMIKRNLCHFNASIANALKPIRKHLGDLLIREVTNERIKRYIEIREADGRKNGTIKKSLDIFVAAMNHARKEGLLDKVPYVTKPPPGAPRDKWATSDQIKQLIVGLEPLPHVRLFALLAIHTLSRKRAVLELKWDQVDLEHRRIHFNPPGRAQTKKRRVPVPINNVLYQELAKAREVAVTPFVIEFRGKACYEIGQCFRRWARKLGYGWITPHIQRHTGATLMAQQGVTTWEIAGIMGDRLDTVEKHYLKHHPDYLKGATEALEKLYA
ncbi:MAG: site-specific integrase, partial [Alphaproteobacteria bacterium]